MPVVSTPVSPSSLLQSRKQSVGDDGVKIASHLRSHLLAHLPPERGRWVVWVPVHKISRRVNILYWSAVYSCKCTRYLAGIQPTSSSVPVVEYGADCGACDLIAHTAHCLRGGKALSSTFVYHRGRRVLG